MQQDANKNTDKNANNRTKHEPETNYKEKNGQDRSCNKSQSSDTR